MKRVTIYFLMLVLLCGMFTGCSSQKAEKPLRICVDLGFHESAFPIVYFTIDDGARNLAAAVTSHGGPSEIELEIIPGEGTARDTTLTRLRTEIMSGGGPDVFICSCVDTSAYGQSEDPLFPYPEKSMADGLFLPLDSFLENAQYMEWEKFQPEIVSAGKTEKGQMILPISFSMPVTVYEAENAALPAAGTNFEDVLSSNDPVMISSLRNTYEYDGQMRLSFPYLFTDYADYSKGELLMGEDQLTRTIDGVLSARENQAGSLPPHFSEQFGFLTYDLQYTGDDPRQGIWGSTDQVMLPLYSEAGGVTALVCSFGAVNANTAQPENAFLVLDLLLSRFMHNNCELYPYICQNSMPVNVEMGEERDRTENSPPPYRVKGCTPINSKAFAAYGKVREQITSSRFITTLDHRLSRLIQICASPEAPDSQDFVQKSVADTITNMKTLLAES